MKFSAEQFINKKINKDEYAGVIKKAILYCDSEIICSDTIMVDFYIHVIEKFVEKFNINLNNSDYDFITNKHKDTKFIKKVANKYEIDVRLPTTDKIKKLQQLMKILKDEKKENISSYYIELIEGFHLNITKDGIETDVSEFVQSGEIKWETDEYKIKEVKYTDSSGKTFSKECKNLGKVDLLRFLYDKFEDNLKELIETGENEDFPTVSDYKIENGIFVPCDSNYQGFWNEKKGGFHYNPFNDQPIKENEYFYIYSWKVLAFLRFIQECLKRFGGENDKIEIFLDYTSKKGEKKDSKDANSSEIGEDIKSIIKKSHNIILYGPPGTGKTREAKNIASYLTNQKVENYEFVQFHPAYTYNDFIETIDITKKSFYYNRIFKQFADKANKSDGNYVLIIDEINRANTAEVLGELLYGLEYREKNVTTSISGDKYSVPKNLYIIGTMNTADRSLQNLDYAIRRRFSFIKIISTPPLSRNDNDTNNRFYKIKDKDRDGSELFFMKNIYNTVKQDIENSCANGVIPEDIMPGVSYFLVKADPDDTNKPWDDHLEYKLRFELIPLLKEYSKDGMFTKRKKLDNGHNENISLVEMILKYENKYYKRLKLPNEEKTNE